MSNKRTIKADAILERVAAEHADDDGFELELAGATYALPGELPGAVLIGFSRLASDDPTGLNMALESLFGREALEALLATNVSFEGLLMLLTEVAGAYGVTLGELPASGASSADTSPSSRPTSPTTTA